MAASCWRAAVSHTRSEGADPEMTTALRAKIFGLNALRVYPINEETIKKHLPKDKVAGERAEYRERPDPTFATHGPKTRREFLNLKAWGGSAQIA